jgi:hypothetical protein
MYHGKWHISMLQICTRNELVTLEMIKCTIYWTFELVASTSLCKILGVYEYLYLYYCFY